MLIPEGYRLLRRDECFKRGDKGGYAEGGTRWWDVSSIFFGQVSSKFLHEIHIRPLGTTPKGNKEII